MLISTRRRLARNRMLRLLDELEAAEGLATSLYIPHDLPLPEVEKTLRAPLGPGVEEALSDIDEALARSKTGAVIFWGEQGKYLVLPPFPLKERLFSSGYDVEPLRALLRQELKVALILLRLDAYAVGVFQGEKLVSSKVGTGLVHSRHRQGGSSAHRFERHREKQMEYFFTRVCGHVREHLEPHLQQVDYVIYGGECHTLLSFRKQCEFLQQLDDRVLSTMLNVREPKQATLEAALTQAWSSEVIEWKEGETKVTYQDKDNS
jgi:peptide subunit release factor 1 (eRF1)